MADLVHRWERDGESVTFQWLGQVDVSPDRVYAFAFTPDRKMLLVTDAKWAPAGWLPGGGVHEDETPLEALGRELLEEANATVVKALPIGVQRAEHSSEGISHHAFYWCRVELGSDFHPEHEVTTRYLVPPDEFLERLFWGRIDPKAQMLLQNALEIDDNEYAGRP